MKFDTFGTVVALVVCAACGGKSPTLAIPVTPMPPASIDDHVVFADSARARAVLLDVSGHAAPGSPTIVPLVPHPTHTEQRRLHTDQLLVLSAGQPDDGTAPQADAGLTVVNADGTTQRYLYGNNAFDAMAQSDDGKFAFLYFDPNATQQTSSLLFVPNEFAVIDLSKPPSTSASQPNPYINSLRSFGSSPQSVAFTQMTLNGESRDLAVVLLDSYLAIKDLNHLERPEYTISLTNPGSNQDIHLSKVIFSTTSNKIYLEANGSDDIYVVKLSDGASPTAGDAGTSLNDFTPSVNQLGAGSGPTDMALYTLPGTTVEKLIVTSPGSSQAVIIEPNTSNVTNVQLPAPASNVLLFKPSPTTPTTAPQALLYTPGVPAVAFLDLLNVEQNTTQNLGFLAVPQPYTTALPLDANTVMLIQQTTGLSLLNLTERTVAQIQGPNLANAISDPVDQKLWLYTDDNVGFLDLKNGIQPDQVRVDAPVQALVTVPSKSRATVVVTYPSSMGWATVLDAADPANLGKAYSMRGFMFSGLLQGGGQ